MHEHLLPVPAAAHDGDSHVEARAEAALATLNPILPLVATAG